MGRTDELAALAEKIKQGGAPKYHQRNADAGKLFCRERIALLCDDGGQDFVEDGLSPTPRRRARPAGRRRRHRRRPRSRAAGRDHGQRLDGEGRARGARAPSRRSSASRRPPGGCASRSSTSSTRRARASPTRSTCSPGGADAGRIFYNQVQLSGAIPQICLLFGPSAAGGAYIPAFCDVVVMVDKNASMYLGSPRMAEMVIGEKVTLEEMGGARMHCEVSGCGDLLAKTRRRASPLRAATSPTCRSARASGPRRSRRARRAPAASASTRSCPRTRTRRSTSPRSSRRSSTRAASSRSRSSSRARSSPASRASTGARSASSPTSRSGRAACSFVDSADKAARFIWLCDAFDVPLLFLADVPGFMIGKKVERQGIIRHGAKMIAAVTDATVPKISVVVRKAYGAGPVRDVRPRLRARRVHRAAAGVDRGHGRRRPRSTRSTTTRSPSAPRPSGPRSSRSCASSTARTSTSSSSPSNLHVDAIVPGDDLRGELSRRLASLESKSVGGYPRRRAVLPV